jgi:ureidoglycolate dehydrogenase (NAD+)
VLNVEMFRPLADFRRDVSDLAAVIRKLPLQQGFDEALMPGERGERRAAKRRAEGIPLPPALWKELTGIAASLGVETPTPVPS